LLKHVFCINEHLNKGSHFFDLQPKEPLRDCKDGAQSGQTAFTAARYSGMERFRVPFYCITSQIVYKTTSNDDFYCFQPALQVLLPYRARKTITIKAEKALQ